MKLVVDFIGLIFPRTCAACGNSLWKNENIICTFCSFHLPKTNFHLEKENPFTRLFWGRVAIENASAFLFFNRGSTVQKLVHALKYKGKKEIGVWFGRQFGQSLKGSAFFNTVEYLLPVPLHTEKLLARGFNQSAEFACGLSESMHVPVDTDTLIRSRPTETQTRKSRYSRWQNVEELFDVLDAAKLAGKHILLVDDVVTTGSTLEACVLALQKIPGISVSLATIAIAAD